MAKLSEIDTIYLVSVLFLQALKYRYVNQETKGTISIVWNHHKCLSEVIPLWLRDHLKKNIFQRRDQL